MLELRIKQGRRHVPLFALPTALGRARAAREIGDTVEAMIAFLDDLGGDPDLETCGLEDDFTDHDHPNNPYRPWDGGAGCPIADAGGGNITDEPHDQEEDMCLAGDDGVFAGPVMGGGGIARDEGPGDPDDAEDGGDTEYNGDEGDYSA